MRECSPNQFVPAGSLNGPRTGAKSLFRNILPISPCGSGFCPDHSRPKLSNPFGINILGILTEKMWHGLFPQSSAKSLLWKILPLSSCGSRFCKHMHRSTTSKSLRMNILEKWTEKMCSVDSRGVRRTIASRRQGSETRQANLLGFRESSHTARRSKEPLDASRPTPFVTSSRDSADATLFLVISSPQSSVPEISMPRTMKTYSVFVLALCLAAPLYAHHVKR